MAPNFKIEQINRYHLKELVSLTNFQPKHGSINTSIWEDGTFIIETLNDKNSYSYEVHIQPGSVSLIISHIQRRSEKEKKFENTVDYYDFKYPSGFSSFDQKQDEQTFLYNSEEERSLLYNSGEERSLLYNSEEEAFQELRKKIIEKINPLILVDNSNYNLITLNLLKSKILTLKCQISKS